MLSAETQKSIVNFLYGQSIRHQNRIDPLDIRPMLGSHDMSFSPMFGRNAENLAEVKLKTTEVELKANGMPPGCFSCHMMDSQSDAYVEHLDHSIVMSAVLKCRNSGCNSARKEFLENIGDDRIRMIDVTVESERDHLSYSVVRDGGIGVRLSEPESRITITAYDKNDPIYLNKKYEEERRLELEQRRRKEKFEAAERQRKLEAERQKMARAQAELDELSLMVEAKPCESTYGVEVW